VEGSSKKIPTVLIYPQLTLVSKGWVLGYATEELFCCIKGKPFELPYTNLSALSAIAMLLDRRVILSNN
jgi:hypothetical protein